MDFGDLELDDDASPPVANSECRSAYAGPVLNPVLAEAEPATCDRSVRVSDDDVAVTGCAPGYIRSRIPGPAGQVQFQIESGSYGEFLVDPDFKSRAWLSATMHATEPVPIKSIGASERISAMDPSGTLQGSMLRSCFLLREELQQGVVLILRNLPVLHVTPGQSFCCISPSNICDIFTGHHRTEALGCHQFDYNLNAQAQLSVGTSAQPPVDQTPAVAATSSITAGADSQLKAPHSAAVTTGCTVPVEVASSGRTHTGIPISSVPHIPSPDAEPISSTALIAGDILQSSPYSQHHHGRIVLRPSQHVNSHPARPEFQAPVQATQPLPQPSAQAALPLLQPAATSPFRSCVRPAGMPIQHGGHNNAAATVSTLRGPQASCQSDAVKPPRAWVENLKQHIRRKQQQAAAPAGTACTAPAPATGAMPGVQSGNVGADGGAVNRASLAERIRTATSCPGGSPRAQLSGHTERGSSPCGLSPVQPVMRPSQPGHRAQASILTGAVAAQRAKVTPMPPAHPAGIARHPSTYQEHSISTTSRAQSLLGRLKGDPRTQGSRSSGRAANTSGGNLASADECGHLQQAPRSGLSTVPYCGDTSAGRRGDSVLPGKMLMMQDSNKRPRGLFLRQQEVLEAAGLGFSQGSGDIC